MAMTARALRAPAKDFILRRSFLHTVTVFIFVPQPVFIPPCPL